MAAKEPRVRLFVSGQQETASYLGCCFRFLGGGSSAASRSFRFLDEGSLGGGSSVGSRSFRFLGKGSSGEDSSEASRGPRPVSSSLQQ